MTPIAMLADLAIGWHITLHHDGTCWRLVLMSRKTDHEHSYQSDDLTRLIHHAWAGAPDGRV